MEKINIILIIIIASYLFYSFIKIKKIKPKKEEEKIPIRKEEKKNYNRYIIAAVVAAVMKEKEYKIKRIVFKGKEEKKSSWKISGRQEIMMKRNVIKTERSF